MRFFLCMLLSFFLVGCKTFSVVNVSRKVCHLGDRTVVILHEDYGPGKVFVHVHVSETTALEAARRVARSQGGQVITLVHQKERDIRFTYHGKHYAFDPNRIYTAEGIKKTLKSHGCYDPQAAKIVSVFASEVLASIPPGKVIAVHNNNGYSLRDYLPNHYLESDAQNLYLKAHSNYRNFFLVTRHHDFSRFKQLGFNVVEQAHDVTNDGSMSVALAKRQYVNVEAAYDQLPQQMNMLKHA